MERIDIIDIELIKHKKTKKKIAEDLGLSVNSISNWCNGKMTSAKVYKYFENLCGAEFMRKLPAR